LVDFLLIGIGIVIVVLIIAIISIFNGLIVKRNRTENAWSQIDVQLKKRVDLIPNLVETVKGYAKHEKEVFENVTKARSALMNASGAKENAMADNMLTGALKSLFAVSENYPDLKASDNFRMLQEELSGIESKIAYARQYYNDSVLAYDNSIETFPNNVLAGLFGFKQIDYFEVEEAEKTTPKINFWEKWFETKFLQTKERAICSSFFSLFC